VLVRAFRVAGEEKSELEAARARLLLLGSDNTEVRETVRERLLPLALSSRDRALPGGFTGSPRRGGAGGGCFVDPDPPLAECEWPRSRGDAVEEAPEAAEPADSGAPAAPVLRAESGDSATLAAASASSAPADVGCVATGAAGGSASIASGARGPRTAAIGGDAVGAEDVCEGSRTRSGGAWMPPLCWLAVESRVGAAGATPKTSAEMVGLGSSTACRPTPN
jgi:hypothetical protein